MFKKRLIRSPLDSVVVWLGWQWWALRAALIAWRRWRVRWRTARGFALSADDSWADGETPRDSVLTEESYADL